MLNFFALEPKEFAALSCDILQRLTGKTFHLTDGPYDEGVDFIHGPDCYGIVGQAKHYINSSVEQLFRDLRQEMEHVRRLRPKAYYLFLSKDLTPRRLREAVEMFQSFTTFDQEHIFTLSRIDALLQGGKYRDILDKYPKLWNFSMDVLGRALYRNVDFDTREILLKSHSCREFVPTGSYCACIEGLEEAHVVLLQGAPGAGKTMISQQAALELARQNYRVYWTTDGNLRDVAEHHG